MAKKPDDEVQLMQLENGLRIDEHALDEALLQQPEQFYRVAKELALQVSRRDAAKQELAEMEANVDVSIRAAADKKDEKITEKAIEAQKRLDANVIEAMEELSHRNLLVGQFAALKEAFQQRGYVLKDLVSLHISSYYSEASAGANSKGLKNASAIMAKEAMRRERRVRE